MSEGSGGAETGLLLPPHVASVDQGEEMPVVGEMGLLIYVAGPLPTPTSLS